MHIFLVCFSKYWEHVGRAWRKRDHPNMLILFYEDMKINPLKKVKEIAEFLGVPITEEMAEKVGNKNFLCVIISLNFQKYERGTSKYIFKLEYL